MMSFRNFGGILVAVGLVALCTLWSGVPNLSAQALAFKASLSGAVYDPTDAPVPEATVTLSNENRGFSRTFNTDMAGRYTFTLVPPADDYTLRVEVTGFQAHVHTGIALGAGQAATQDVVLALGALTEQVTVTADAPMLKTSDANVSSDIGEREVVELPLNWRSVFGLVLLDSSVHNSAPFQIINPPGVSVGAGPAEQVIGFFQFGGGRFGTTAYLLDGHWNNLDWGVIYVPGVDETQEVKIQTHGFTAQYGWSTGNVLNAITKSGGNDFHGTVFEFLRNDNLDATNFITNRNSLSKPEFKRNQFGFSLGGPIRRDKTFFFGHYEGLRHSTPATLITSVPTADMRTGNFESQLGAQIGTDALGRPVLSGQIYDPFTTRAIKVGELDTLTNRMPTASGFIRDPIVGNIIPGTLLDPVAQNIIPFWPSPTGPGSGINEVDNFAATGALTGLMDAYTVRIDHTISDKSSLFGRWSRKRIISTNAGAFFGEDNPGGNEAVAPNNRWDAAFNFNHVFTPTLLMSINWGWNRWAEGRVAQGDGFLPSQLGLPAFLDGVAPNFPSINISDMSGLAQNNGNSVFPRETRTYAVDFTKIAGSHSMTMGFMAVDFHWRSPFATQAAFPFPRSMTQGPDPTVANPLTGFGFASFLLGTGQSSNLSGQRTTTGVRLRAPGAIQRSQVGVYFQDDWKVTRRLTLNLGIRWEIQNAPTDRFDRIASFDFNAANPVGAAASFPVNGQLVFTDENRRGIYDPSKRDFAPRLGLAYRVTEKLVMRAGFGIFYVPALQVSLPFPGFEQVTPFVGTVDGINPVNTLSNPFPGGLIPPVGKAAEGATFVGFNVDAVEQNRPTPYITQWTFGFQYELSSNNSLEVTYIGNHGVKLPFGSIQRNTLTTQSLSLGDSLLDPVANPFFEHISASSCGLDGPTVPRRQLLRPFPQYCNVSHRQPPAGFSRYDALQVTFTHRWSQGLHFLASYTTSKFLDDSGGPGSWSLGASNNLQNPYDLRAERSLNGGDIPHSLVLSYIYELPFGRGKSMGSNFSQPLNAILGGWQVSGIGTFKDGFPLAIRNATNNTGSLGGGQRPNIIGDASISNPTVDRWFNSDPGVAFAQPAPFTFGDGPRTNSNLRSPGSNNWDLSIMKWWRQSEQVRVQFRFEMYNAFNRTYLYVPNTSFGSSSFGRISSAGPPRSIQFGLKVYF